MRNLIGSKGPDFSERLSRLFGESSRVTDSAIDDLFAKSAKDGQLKSGATIKRALGLHEDRTTEAVDEALKNISGRTEISGRLRNELVSKLRVQTTEHLNGKWSEISVRLGAIGLDAALARSLFASVCTRVDNKIKDYQEGWTSPRAAPFKDRRPLVWQAGNLIIGAVIGAAIKALLP